MSTAVWTNQLEPNSVADKALKAAAGRWFLVAGIGQWAFLDMAYVPGDTGGSLALAAHTLLAAVIAFGVAMQLIPQIRARAISVHRWICGFPELYLCTRKRAGPRWRFALAGGLAVLTVLMSVGIFGFTMLTWRFLARL
jgi:hypothetical protein